MCAYTTHRLKNASTTHSAFLISKSTLCLCFYCSPLAFIPRVTGKFNVLFSNKLSALCKSGVSIWFLHSPLHYTEVKPEMPTSYRNTESIRWIMEKVNKSTTQHTGTVPAIIISSGNLFNKSEEFPVSSQKTSMSVYLPLLISLLRRGVLFIFLSSACVTPPANFKFVMNNLKISRIMCRTLALLEKDILIKLDAYWLRFEVACFVWQYIYDLRL